MGLHERYPDRELTPRQRTALGMLFGGFVIFGLMEVTDNNGDRTALIEDCVEDLTGTSVDIGINPETNLMMVPEATEDAQLACLATDGNTDNAKERFSE